MAKVRVRSQAASDDAIDFDGAETPTRQVVKAAGTTKTVTTLNGRTLVVKRPNALQRLRITDVNGANSAANEIYLGQVMIAVCVVSIDGDPVPFPTSKAQIEHLVQRLDDDGLGAAALGLRDLMGAQAEDRNEQVAQIKNE